MHNPTSFILHLHLLACVTILQERIDVREDIEGYLVRIDILTDRAPLGDCLDLVAEFLDCSGSRARDGLIARSNDPLQSEGLMQGIDCHQRDCRGAVRISQNPGMRSNIGGVNLRND